jgi:hypothetical protein
MSVWAPRGDANYSPRLPPRKCRQSAIPLVRVRAWSCPRQSHGASAGCEDEGRPRADHRPELRLVVVHGRGFLPFQAARFDRDAKGGNEDRRLPSEVVRSLYYDTVLLSTEAVRFLYDYVGADRVVIGSDFGAAPAERSGVLVAAAVNEASDDPDVTAAVLTGNARSLFGVN